MHKTPAIVLVFFNFDEIRKTIEFLVNSGNFDIYVLENHSEHTENRIKPYLLNLLENGIIRCYVYFERNISNNAYKLFFNSHKIKFNSEYILITDGDIIVEPKINLPHWFDEQIAIINNNQNIVTCGINLLNTNLPFKNPFFNQVGHFIYDCKFWDPEKIGIMHEDYLEAGTGIHLLTLRTDIFNNYIEWINNKRLHFLDENLRYFISEFNNYKWALTKQNKGLHLTWSIYDDINHPYTKFKMNPNFYTFWKHYDYCSYTIYYRDSIKRHKPLIVFWSDFKHKILNKKLKYFNAI